MDASKDYLRKNNILPKVKFKDGLKHILTLIEDREDMLVNDGKEIEGIKYKVKENGEEKVFFTSSEALIQELSTFQKNEVVSIQLKSIKSGDGYVSKYEVFPAGEDAIVPDVS